MTKKAQFQAVACTLILSVAGKKMPFEKVLMIGFKATDASISKSVEGFIKQFSRYHQTKKSMKVIIEKVKGSR